MSQTSPQPASSDDPWVCIPVSSAIGSQLSPSGLPSMESTIQCKKCSGIWPISYYHNTDEETGEFAEKESKICRKCKVSESKEPKTEETRRCSTCSSDQPIKDFQVPTMNELSIQCNLCRAGPRTLRSRYRTPAPETESSSVPLSPPETPAKLSFEKKACSTKTLQRTRPMLSRASKDNCETCGTSEWFYPLETTDMMLGQSSRKCRRCYDMPKSASLGFKLRKGKRAQASSSSGDKLNHRSPKRAQSQSSVKLVLKMVPRCKQCNGKLPKSSTTSDTVLENPQLCGFCRAVERLETNNTEFDPIYGGESQRSWVMRQQEARIKELEKLVIHQQKRKIKELEEQLSSLSNKE